MNTPTFSLRETNMTKFIKPFGDDQPEIGDKMIRWANELYPIRRSISGPGVRATIAYLKGLMR